MARAFCCFPCLPAPANLGPPKHLEEPWRELLHNGEVWTALVLSTLFSEKYKGRHMAPGASAEIQMPGGDRSEFWRPTLLHRIGSKEACMFIWRGEGKELRPTLYFAFSPLRKRTQFLKIANQFGAVNQHTFRAPHADPDGEEASVTMLSYVHRKLRNMWEKYGCQAALDDALQQHPDHEVICCGLSHGAALAQAMVLKLTLMYPERTIQAVTWNAYKFLDDAGAALIDVSVGRRLLPLVMSRRGYWDSIAGAPHDLTPVPNIIFLDADTGECRPAEDVRRTRPSCGNFWRMYRLHFARTAIKATRMATIASREAERTRQTVDSALGGAGAATPLNG